MVLRHLIAAALVGFCSGCGSDQGYKAIGQVEIFDDRARALIPDGAIIEKLTKDHFTWSEGPVWIADNASGMVLFSDVPNNTIYSWSEENGVDVFLSPSGLAEPDEDGVFREPGSNGLIHDDDGAVLMGDHGNRAISRLDLATRTKTTVVDRFGDDRFNSPNDLVLSRSGAIYFSDPPYGLAQGDESPAKELDINGVYRFMPGADGDFDLALIDDGLSRPNGVALSPDESHLYVAASDRDAAMIYRYKLNDAGYATGRDVFFDATDMVGEDAPGLPDGMAVDIHGNVYATGPGGVHVLSPEGERLALISTGTATANCAFGDDGSTLYITSGAFLARISLTTRGVGFP